MRNGWKHGTPNYYAYDLMVRELNKVSNKYLTLTQSSSPNLPEDSAQAGKEESKKLTGHEWEFEQFPPKQFQTPATQPSPLPEDVEKELRVQAEQYVLDNGIRDLSVDECVRLHKAHIAGAKSQQTNKRKVAERVLRFCEDFMPPQTKQSIMYIEYKENMLNNLK